MDNAGYYGRLTDFMATDNNHIYNQLYSYIQDADASQIRAWKESVKLIKSAIKELLSKNDFIAENCSIIFEYTIPLESRRVDVVLLLNGIVFAIEFKGKSISKQADIDQAAAYVRDLKAYHSECSHTPVKGLLVLTRLRGDRIEKAGEVDVLGPGLLLSYLDAKIQHDVLAPDHIKFLSLDSYRPLPSLIKAARELFKSGTIPRVHRAATATEPTLAECSSIIHTTAETKRRALILICGVPGAGKTLVGLQIAHSKNIDDLAIIRDSGEKSTVSAVFLSGNGPLVEVLQYELRSVGGGGKAFVRGVHEYVKTFTKRANLVPPHHVLIYDEAQRAFDAEQVQVKHKGMPKVFQGLSEPELFIQFAERVPEWCVVVGLIGAGQEIHIGEEAGICQWKRAIKKSAMPDSWDVFIPKCNKIKKIFKNLQRVECKETLKLSSTIRFHLATQLNEFVEALLDSQSNRAKDISVELEENSFNLRLTHDLEIAKEYLLNRYDRNPDVRFGVIASSKDKELINFGVPKGYKNPGEVRPGKYGKWYTEAKGSTVSCTGLDTVATEFGTQGLELDACLLAWGTDFIRENNSWSNRFAAGYRFANRVKDPMVLRMNAYRVLLTRGRDCCVVFVPPIPNKMRETYKYLLDCGFHELERTQNQN